MRPPVTRTTSMLLLCSIFTSRSSSFLPSSSSIVLRRFFTTTRRITTVSSSRRIIPVRRQQQQQQQQQYSSIISKVVFGTTSETTQWRYPIIRNENVSFQSRCSFLCMTKTSTSSSSTDNIESSTSSSSSDSLKGITFVKDAVLQVLNDLFDPAEVARGAALAKLDKGKKKKKKKKKQQQPEEDEPNELSDEERRAIGDAAAAAAKPFTYDDVMVTPATKDEFGDYQCNAAMGLAKSLGMSPRDCATQIVQALTPLVNTVMDEPEIAGPGFINLRFQTDYLSHAIQRMADDVDHRLGVPKVKTPQKIVIDFSSPNIAKEMHVGHLRSTIIGDTLSNTLEFIGHDVKRLNHVGDWGTQFGMLVEHLRDEYPEALQPDHADTVDLGDLVELYKKAKKRFDEDEEFKKRAREGVVKLQKGDEESLAAWESLCMASRVEYQKIYDMLNIQNLIERGESFYNPYLNDVIEDLKRENIAVESEGAMAVFLDGYTNRDGTPLPLIIQKSDGGFNYATTDLAAIRHRVLLTDGENADRVLYVTDSGQSQHFQMVFDVAKTARFVSPENEVSLEHVPFGLVQGEDGKKFATRSGDTVKLKDLLNEAIKIAGDDVKSRMEEGQKLTKEMERVIHTVGIGAVKYADLSMNRESNYKFSYERMLSLNGNTAPYMLYAYARICGIVRKAMGGGGGGGQMEEHETMTWPEAAEEIIISQDSELQLVRNLVKLPDVLNEVERDLYPNRICDYLFETSQKFNQFYENCAVNNAETPELKASRLTLCTVTAATIRLLMGILGIRVVERL